MSLDLRVVSALVVGILSLGCGDETEPDLAPLQSALAAYLTPGSQLLAVLPDTQYYSRDYPALFSLQTQWVAEASDPFDIRYVVHLGDIVDDNSPTQWHRAREAFSLLDELVPYVIVPGNHDYGPNGDASTRETLLNDVFPVEDVARWATFGGAYEAGKLDNTYHLFSAGGRDFIVMALEWGPRDEVLDWANGVMEEHLDRDGILVTHAYMNHNDWRYDHTDMAHPQDFNPYFYGTEGGVTDGEEIWQKLVRHHRFVMTLSGHVLDDGTGYLASTTDLGNVCHQMLSNYQTREMGGEGYMRLLELLPDGETVEVYSYSPLYDDVLQSPDQRFTLSLR